MIGVDEVGRGCLAGPLLVVAARATSSLPLGIKDSKLLTVKQRLKTLDLLSNGCDFAEGWVSVAEIDSKGIAAAMRLGVARALEGIGAEIKELIILDGQINYAPVKFFKVQTIIAADASVPLVSAASIYAKVTRDNLMRQLKDNYPSYGFENHVGYGTKAHLKAIASYGPLLGIHRLSFRPLRGFMVNG